MFALDVPATCPVEYENDNNQDEYENGRLTAVDHRRKRGGTRWRAALVDGWTLSAPHGPEACVRSARSVKRFFEDSLEQNDIRRPNVARNVRFPAAIA